jgi:hypothetical protein
MDTGMDACIDVEVCLGIGNPSAYELVPSVDSTILPISQPGNEPLKAW